MIQWVLQGVLSYMVALVTIHAWHDFFASVQFYRKYWEVDGKPVTYKDAWVKAWANDTELHKWMIDMTACLIYTFVLMGLYHWM